MRNYVFVFSHRENIKSSHEEIYAIKQLKNAFGTQNAHNSPMNIPN